MPPTSAAVLLLLAAYLVGAIPFGYLIGRFRGVNLFEAGSGNIGATNAARVLGARTGAVVFLLDFLKGAAPVAAVVPLARAIAPGADTALGPPDVLRVCAAALAFLGHLYPIYLGFRGGKGVATGAGTIFVLVPGPAALAVLAWITVLLGTRIVSLASLVAVTLLVIARLTSTPAPFSPDDQPITLFLFAGAVMVFVKHSANIGRLAAGTESRIGEFTMRETILRGLHIMALSLWFGGAAFFNFIAAVPIFRSFEEVVHGGPSDRTAGETIIPPDASEERKKALASALAGSAVGPVFPRYFAMQAVCGLIALVTALNWWNAEGGRKVHHWRVLLIAAGVFTVAVGWPLSNYVSELRLARFSADDAMANAAKAAFGTWHRASLLLSTVTVCLAGAAMALAGKLPRDHPPSIANNSTSQEMTADQRG
jgi:acyl phosphate:glycerol-3-phosphate acyltransferase